MKLVGVMLLGSCEEQKSEICIPNMIANYLSFVKHFRVLSTPSPTLGEHDKIALFIGF